MSHPAEAPLAGLTVLELGQIYNGPYCGLLLAHHGAEVIKIEAPQGDVLRRMDRSPGGASYPFLMLNASKRSVRIDLKQPRGRELLLDLAARADVLVENFAAGVVERLGVDYAAVAARNPGIVLMS
jgi:crotonobetainyl-CoA:carnitine CoA-transferase CaiB-like acyl-CoA transferase